MTHAPPEPNTVVIHGVRRMMRKIVKAQGPGAGRIYLPVSEVGHEAIIIFVD